MAAATAPDRIVIGVDFGTTFSGVAEAYSGTPVTAEDINVIKTWPSGSNVTSDKVPSEIAYSEPKAFTAAGVASSSTGDVFDTSALQASLEQHATDSNGKQIRWGFQLRHDEPRLRCVKLFLDPGQELPSFVSKSEIQQLIAESGKDAVSVVADYLSQIYKHTQGELIKRYGDLFMQTTETQWILTVPAIWSDAAKDATLTAAKKAGMGPDIALISEPEAAAVYTLQAIQPNHLRVGDNFVVCDAGGGTVDLISYELKQIRPLRIEESAEGSGACCGAAMLNAKFETLVRQKMGADAYSKLCRSKSRTWLTALKYFEDYVKRNFDPTAPTDFNIPFPGVPDDEHAGIDQGFFTLTFEDLKTMFRPIINDICDLVEGQIDKVQKKGKKVAGVVLVGGFGQSGCLYKALKLKGQRADPPFEVMQPLNAWTAVVRGAVLRGVEGVEMVLSRTSRRHYGIVTRMPFSQGNHPASCKVWDANEGVWKATDRMRWYIKKGQTVSSTQPMLFDFYRTSANGFNAVFPMDLIYCDSKKAPAGYASHEHAATKVLCSMMVNLTAVPGHLYKTRVSPEGRPYQRLDYQVGMQLGSGGLTFDLRVDGVVYGKVTAKFDSQ